VDGCRVFGPFAGGLTRFFAVRDLLSCMRTHRRHRIAIAAGIATAILLIPAALGEPGSH
jgi:hypothetical protein